MSVLQSESATRATLPIVCHIITKLELGGAQAVALFTVANLDRRRFRPVLVTGDGGLLNDEAMALGDVEVRIVSSLDRAIRPVKDIRAFLGLLQLLVQLRPKIVHTHSSKAGILGRWAAWFARVPVILHTIHGYGITPEDTGWRRRLFFLLERLTGLITTQWVAVARADVDQGAQWKLFRANDVLVIRPGIDAAPFRPPLSDQERAKLRAELGAGASHMLVGMVACLKPQKAPEDFVRVAAHVHAKLPSVRFVLVGDGELREIVEAQVRTAKLTEHFRVIGWRRDIPRVMQALDVFVLTSRWEGLARVLLEARIAGTPVVATRVGGAAEAIQEGRHGWLCEAGDVVGIATRVCGALRQSKARGDLPLEFDIHEMLKQYENLYDKLLLASAAHWRSAQSTA